MVPPTYTSASFDETLGGGSLKRRVLKDILPWPILALAMV